MESDDDENEDFRGFIINPKWVLSFITRRKVEPTDLRNEGFKRGFDERKTQPQIPRKMIDLTWEKHT